MRLSGLLLAVAALILLAYPGDKLDAHEELASALVLRSDGQTVGLATFTESVHGEVRVTFDARGLPPGEHGFHIHEVGRCDPPAFTSSGGHFNPLGRRHGLSTSEGPHAGDLPNLMVAADGSAHFDMVINRFTLHPGPLNILDDNGSALIIHALPDDHITDPTGNSGDRIACAVISATVPAAAG